MSTIGYLSHYNIYMYIHIHIYIYTYIMKYGLSDRAMPGAWEFGGGFRTASRGGEGKEGWGGNQGDT